MDKETLRKINDCVAEIRGGDRDAVAFSDAQSTTILPFSSNAESCEYLTMTDNTGTVIGLLVNLTASGDCVDNAMIFCYPGNVRMFDPGFKNLYRTATYGSSSVKYKYSAVSGGQVKYNIEFAANGVTYQVTAYCLGSTAIGNILSEIFA